MRLSCFTNSVSRTSAVQLPYKSSYPVTCRPASERQFVSERHLGASQSGDLLCEPRSHVSAACPVLTSTGFSTVTLGNMVFCPMIGIEPSLVIVPHQDFDRFPDEYFDIVGVVILFNYGLVSYAAHAPMRVSLAQEQPLLHFTSDGSGVLVFRRTWLRAARRRTRARVWQRGASPSDVPAKKLARQG